MGWREFSYWKKGLILGLILGFVLGVFIGIYNANIFLKLQEKLWSSGLGDMFGKSWVEKSFDITIWAVYVLKSVLFWTPVGMILGSVVGKIIGIIKKSSEAKGLKV